MKSIFKMKSTKTSTAVLLFAFSFFGLTAKAQVLSFDVPSSNSINLGNVSRLALKGNCVSAGEQVYIKAGSQNPLTVTCTQSAESAALQWKTNLSLVDQSDGSMAISIWRQSQSASPVIRTFVKDTLSPLLSVMVPRNGDYISAETVSSFRVSGNCGEIGQSVNVVFRRAVDDGTSPKIEKSLPCTSRIYSGVFNLSTLGDNTDIALAVTHKDSAGNETIRSSSYYMDVQAETVAFSGLPEFINAGNSATLMFHGACNKRDGYVFLDISVEGTSYSQNLETMCDENQWSIPAVSLAGTSVPDGVLKLRLSLTNAITFSEGTTTVTLIKDTVAPTVAILSPANGYRMTLASGASLTVSGRCSESGRPVNITSGSLAVAANCNSGAYTAVLNFAALADGDQQIRVIQSDAAGNSAVQSLSFNKDVRPATLTVDPISTITSLNATTMILKGTCSEFGSYARPVQISGGINAIAQCLSPGLWSLTASLATLPDGVVTLNFDHSDQAGNAAPRVVRIVNKDTVPPTVIITRPVSAASPKYMINSANVGSVEFGGTCTKAGTITVLGAGPGTSTCNGGVWSYRPNLAAVADGDLTFGFRIVDALGQSSQQDIIVFKDTIPPSLSVIPNPVQVSVGSVANVVLQGSCSEYGSFAQPVKVEGSGIGSLQAVCNPPSGSWSLSVAKTAFSEGSSTVTVSHQDLVGNKATVSVSVSKDSTPPQLTLQAPPTNYYLNILNKRFTLRGTCSETGRSVVFSGANAGTANCASGNYALDMDFSTVSDGDLLIRATHSDAAGNAAVQEMVLHKDTVPPQIAIVSPAAGAQLVSGNNTFSGSCANGSGSIRIERVTPTALATNCAGNSWSMSVNTSAMVTLSGNVNMTLKWQDAAGNTASASRSFRMTAAELNTAAAEDQGILSMVPSKNRAQQTLGAGHTHTCIVAPTGQVKCWGSNSSSQLGNGTTADSADPVIVSGITNAISVSGGVLHTCALLNTGQVKCWGWNAMGQLAHGRIGDSATSGSSVPVLAKGIANAVSLSSGYYHTCVVLSTGQVKCWGSNTSSQLGNGTTADSADPVIVSGITNAVYVSAGRLNTCAVLSTGQVQCWGNNDFGQLGNNTTVGSRLPAMVSGITNAVAVSVGFYNACAVLSTGQVQCWGYNRLGQLGNNTTVGSPLPVVVSGITNAVAVSVRYDHACAVLSSGEVQCWGYNISGQLGHNSTAMNSTVPVVASGITNAVTVSVGVSHSCAMLNDGQVKCWGQNGAHQLGNSMVSRHSFPEEVIGIENAMSTSMIGNGTFFNGCAVISSGQVKCWGHNSHGQLGNNTTVNSLLPVVVSGITNAVKVSVGNVYSCALLNDGQVKCWGTNTDGQLGNNTENLRSRVPLTVTGILNAVSIATGMDHTCAVLITGQVKCWGRSDFGKAGAMPIVREPAFIDGITNAISVSAGMMHTCAVLITGQVKCWGWNVGGVLGSSRSGWAVPAFVTGITNAVSVSAGEYNTCVVLRTGQVQCWGSNYWGPLLGNHRGSGSSEPVPISGIDNAVSVAVGRSHACALLDTGELRCWGSNAGKQLGNSVMEKSYTPVVVEGNFKAQSLVVSKLSSMMIDLNGKLLFWGTKAFSFTPVTLSDLTASVPSTIGLGIIGHVEALNSSTGIIKGWACAQGSPSSIRVRVYLGGPQNVGESLPVVMANKSSEAAVANACGSNGTAYRYSIPLSATLRVQYKDKPIHVYGLSPYGFLDKELVNSGKVIVH